MQRVDGECSMLSVLVAVKNEAQYIESALRSVAGYEGLIEVVVVDDGSTDGTPDLINSLSFPYVKLIRTDGVGKARAYSLAYENSSGDFFVLFAGDDLIVVDALAARVAPLLQQAPGMPAVTFCKLKSFSKNPKYDGMILPKAAWRGLESGGCIAFNRAFAQRAFPIPSMLANEDSWLMLQVRYAQVMVKHVPVVGLQYRIHGGNSYQRGVSFAAVNEQMWLRQRAIFYFYEKYRSELTDKQQKELLVEFSIQLLRYLGRGFALWGVGGSFNFSLKAMLHSKSWLYWVRERFYKFFSGR